MQLYALESRLKIFCTLVCKNYSSCRLKFPGKKKKLQTNQMENLKKGTEEY